MRLGGGVEKIYSVADIERLDSSEAYPRRTPLESIALAKLIDRVAARLGRETDVAFEVDDYSGFQYGAILTRVCERRTDIHGVRGLPLSEIRFSKFGKLVSATRGRESGVSDVEWERLLSAIAMDYGFSVVDDSVLAMPYQGVFQTFKCDTWEDRFFCGWYR
jgi:hypothetical protein